MAGLAHYVRLLRQQFPALRLRTLRPITHGWDSFVLEVNEELIFRFPRRQEVQVAVQREIDLLPQLTPALAVPVPQFCYPGQMTPGRPSPFVGYPKLTGVTLQRAHLSDEQVASLVPALAAFLDALHRFPQTRALQAGVEGHTPQQWRARYRALHRQVFPLLDRQGRQLSARLWEDGLQDGARTVFEPVLIHGDLAGEHLLCDPGRGILSGVIDWGDLAIGDPALDLVGLYNQFGTDLTHQVVACSQLRGERALWRRVAFYLQCLPFTRLLFAVEQGREPEIERGKAELYAHLGI